ncbi:MAG: DUF86 domain-containing protein [Balneolaceae bacterium]
MSKKMKSDKIYILHMIDSMDQISEYTDQITREEYQENRLIQDAVVRNFEIIGEAAKNVSRNTRERFSQISLLFEFVAGELLVIIRVGGVLRSSRHPESFRDKFRKPKRVVIIPAHRIALFVYGYSYRAKVVG